MHPPCGVPANGGPWRDAEDTLPEASKTTRTLAVPGTPLQLLAELAAAARVVIAAPLSKSLPEPVCTGGITLTGAPAWHFMRHMRSPAEQAHGRLAGAGGLGEGDGAGAGGGGVGWGCASSATHPEPSTNRVPAGQSASNLPTHLAPSQVEPAGQVTSFTTSVRTQVVPFQPLPDGHTGSMGFAA